MEDQADVHYGKWWFSLKGGTVICAVMIAIFGMLSLGLQRDGNAQAEARIVQHEQNAGEFRAEIGAKQDRVIEATEKNTAAMMAMIYVISLPQEKREKLNLAEPPQLRQMMRKREE